MRGCKSELIYMESLIVIRYPLVVVVGLIGGHVIVRRVFIVKCKLYVSSLRLSTAVVAYIWMRGYASEFFLFFGVAAPIATEKANYTYDQPPTQKALQQAPRITYNG